ncbi:MAG: nitroreductase family protein [Candidatus Nanoarchaeia archaeon]|nr:nitroreductase family protein [Candidatus Nanoarchaeia archaeon]
MELQQCIQNRRSVRKYKEQEVPNELVCEILEMARLAPSAYNAQNWRFIIITEKNKKKEISEACFSQHWISEAPMLIVVCNFHKRLRDMHKDKGMLFSTQNCAIISSYIQLLAVERGLGTCWVGAFNPEELNRIIHSPILQVPADVKVEAVLTLGFPDDKKHEGHIRNEFNNFCYFDKWGSKDAKVEKAGITEKVKKKTGFFKDLFSIKVRE